MRPIHLARLDKTRPVVILSRQTVRARMRRVTVAPITSTIRGLVTEVAVGPDNGLDKPGVISCDNIVTVPVEDIGRRVGFLRVEQETDLATAIVKAFGLEWN